MNLIKSLMGRRQFLIATGVGSTSALALKKLAGLADPVFKTGIANAAGSPGTADMKGVNNQKCVVIYSSMTGNTEKAARAIQRGVEQAAGNCDIFPIKEA